MRIVTISAVIKAKSFGVARGDHLPHLGLSQYILGQSPLQIPL